MKEFRLDQLEAERTAHDGAYLRFLTERTMSAGLYALDVGQQDGQRPQRQDVMNFVVSGRGSLTVGEETTTVARGSVVFVPAGVQARFHHITEDLRVMVIFSPPEGS
ncbi:cupin domain-containing protein [Streptomyces avicenniae]|uniref:cupin domain-containing protein n=1 Tax=Streptomyces avicenniae TaxID=500153 RepID=UPI00069CA293|nr:cupin domain-containing protein [Streptomyces avicenniae]